MLSAGGRLPGEVAGVKQHTPNSAASTRTASAWRGFGLGTVGSRWRSGPTTALAAGSPCVQVEIQLAMPWRINRVSPPEIGCPCATSNLPRRRSSYRAAKADPTGATVETGGGDALRAVLFPVVTTLAPDCADAR